MFKQRDSSSRYKMDGCFFEQILRNLKFEMCDGFCLNIAKGFLVEALFQSQQKDLLFFWKSVLGIFRIALRFRDWHGISNIFNTLTLKQVSENLNFS